MKAEYNYYLLYDRWLARLEKGRYDLEPKEFFKNGVWAEDDNLNRQLNDAMMDYGDSSVFDYDMISEEKAMAFIRSQENDLDYAVILFPEFVALKAEVEKLRAEVASLLLEKDELRFVICKNIETEYMLKLGGLEHKAFELNCWVLRLKRKIELVQAKKNRQEKIVLSEIEDILDEEFAEFQRQLNEQIEQMNEAIEHSKGRVLSDEETKEFKQLYRNIVKALHPDLNPNVTPAQMQLFQNAVQAYKNGDLDYLRIISEMVADPDLPEDTENGMAALIKTKEKLTKSVERMKEQIERIKSRYPYTMKDLLNNPEEVEKRRAELKAAVAELKELKKWYDARLKELLR